MKKLSFHGAAGTVTGSCFRIEDDNSNILIDCGFFQGPPELEAQNAAPFGFEPALLTGVLLTHAHLDHCGRLPKLVKEGYMGPIYMTPATRDLLEIGLNDAAKIMAEHDPIHAIYTEEEVMQVLDAAKLVEYNKPFQFAGYTITYVNAGHILGSASILLEKDGQKIAMSGDLGNSPQDIIQPTQYFTDADFVVMESTYGNSLHPAEDPVNVMRDEINAVEANDGALLIPAFSIERTQEILHKIDHLKKKGDIKEATPVFLDSPMAIHATDVFRRFTNLYNKEMSGHLVNDDPFTFPGLQVIYRGKDSASLKDIHGPKVIIAGSGMMTGGRILNHAQTFLPLESTRLLIVGYQAENTIGRQIKEGATSVKVYGQTVQVRAHVAETQAMSSHADQKELLNWYGHIKGVQKVCLIHGEDPARAGLEEEIKKSGTVEIIKPYKGDSISL